MGSTSACLIVLLFQLVKGFLLLAKFLILKNVLGIGNDYATLVVSSTFLNDILAFTVILIQKEITVFPPFLIAL